MALQNKLFSTNTIPENNQVSKIRTNREYMLSKNTAYELNTYINFGAFASFNDVFAESYSPADNYTKPQGSIGTPGVRSIFNRAGAVLIGSSDGKIPNQNQIINQPSELRISNNVPLMDTPDTRKKIRNNSGCSIKELVQASSAGLLGRAIYSYSDFMYCKYLGKIPNNYLITLRRFPIPVGDFISSLGVGNTRRAEGKNNSPQQIGCLVNWLGVSGNNINDIMKYSMSMPFTEVNAKWNDVEGGYADEGGGKLLNGIAAAFDPTYRKQYQEGYGGQDIQQFMGKFYADTGRYDANRDATWTDDNKVYGPVDRVKSTYMRSEDGIKFEQDFTLVFEYELRSYNGINPRQAMLDLLSNILNVVYTTGDFWGGGYKGGGMHQNSLFSNMKVFKTSGGFSNFIDAFSSDISTLTAGVRKSLEGKDFLTIAQNFLNQLGGLILGGALNKLGRPAKLYANSLLSEQPVGLWHVMIGNPHHPILSLGNMVLKNTTIEHYGPLGLDDFPTGLRVTCELTRGKPRDLREIEKMYMHGNDRIYHGMGKKIFDMYQSAQEYQSRKSFNTYESYADMAGELNTKKATVTNKVNISELTGISEGDLKNMKGILQKYFGETDTYSIYVAAAEQEYGSQKRKKKGENDASFKQSKQTQY